MTGAAFEAEEWLHRFEMLGGRAFVIGGELLFGFAVLDMEGLGAMIDELRCDQRHREAVTRLASVLGGAGQVSAGAP